MWTATTSLRNTWSGGKLSDDGRRCRRSKQLLDSAVTDVSSDRERELLRRLRHRRRWRGKWLSMAGAAAAVLVLLTLFHSAPEKFLFPNRIAQQQPAVTEQRSDAIERDLTSARETAGSVQRELSRNPSEPVDARREGSVEPSSQPRILEGTTTTAGREPADTASAFGSTDRVGMAWRRLCLGRASPALRQPFQEPFAGFLWGGEAGEAGAVPRASSLDVMLGSPQQQRRNHEPSHTQAGEPRPIK
jgi:hypothetical protein